MTVDRFIVGKEFHSLRVTLFVYWKMDYGLVSDHCMDLVLLLENETWELVDVKTWGRVFDTGNEENNIR